MNNCFCVCFCEPSKSSYINHWESFFRLPNTFSITDTMGKNVDSPRLNELLYQESDLRKNLNFGRDVSKMHFWNSIGNRNVVWFYAHFRMLNFYLSHPNYDYYWFFDDDVKCEDWKSVFSTTKYDSDFLSYFVFKNINVESQPMVPKIDDKTYSKADWFNRFPGDGDLLPSTDQYFGSFFAITRYSNAAMRTLLNLNNEGFSGYSEGFVPTMLNRAGHKLDTLLQPDHTSRHFDTNTVKITHKNTIVNWEWI